MQLNKSLFICAFGLVCSLSNPLMCKSGLSRKDFMRWVRKEVAHLLCLPETALCFDLDDAEKGSPRAILRDVTGTIESKIEAFENNSWWGGGGYKLDEALSEARRCVENCLIEEATERTKSKPGFTTSQASDAMRAIKILIRLEAKKPNFENFSGVMDDRLEDIVSQSLELACDEDWRYALGRILEARMAGTAELVDDDGDGFVKKPCCLFGNSSEVKDAT